MGYGFWVPLHSLACLVATRWCAVSRPVRSLSVLPWALPTPWCLSPDLLGGCAGHLEAGREWGSLCLPLAPPKAGTLGPLRVVPFRGPAMGLSLAGPSGVGLWLRALRWFACVDPVGDATGFPYCPSFDGGLGRCTGAVSCGRQHRFFWVGGRHARVLCVCSCACPSWPRRAGRPPRRVLVRLTFSCGRSSCAVCLFGPLRAGVALFIVAGFFYFSFPCCAPVVSGVPCFPAQGTLGLRVLRSSRPPLFFAFGFLSPSAPTVSGVPCSSARGALGLGVLWSSPPPALLFLMFFGLFRFVFLFFCAPLSLVIRCFPSGVPWALALCGPAARPPSVFFSSSLVPPPFVFCFARCAPVFVSFLFFFLFLFLPLFSSSLVCPLCGASAGLCVLGCGVCWCVLLWVLCPGGGRSALALCRWVLPGCACSVCGVACRVAVFRFVLCFARCCVACLCEAWFLLRAAAPCCRCLAPCRGRWLCSVLGCGAALLWCAACRAVCCCPRRVLLVVPCCFVRAGWCCVLLPVVAGCWLLGLVACCCFLLACVVAGAPGWPPGLLPCCDLSFVVVPRSSVVCPVFCGAVLPCGALL